MNINEVLENVYNNKIDETFLMKLSKKELSDFILEVFNKGLLNDYYNLK
jgi:hypothetical protein